MKKNRIKWIAICAALAVLLASFAGCGGTKADQTSSTASETEAQSTTQAAAQNFWEMLGSVSDTSDLPDWTGKQLKLVEWLGHGSGSADHSKATQDVVMPEAKRVTGVELDVENSFDNGGSSIDVKLSLLAAANDWPDIISTSGTSLIKDLVTSGELYDLTDLLPKYCPNIMKLFDTSKSTKIMDNITAEISDKIYFVPNEASKEFMYVVNKDNPEFDMGRWSRIAPPAPVVDWPRIWVRDDILKKMYPNAKTQDEIEALYVKNGAFTKEEIFDVPIKSTADFYQFMKDMKALIDKEQIKESGKPVQVAYAAFGGDNWPVATCLLPNVNGVPGYAFDYFTYFDKKIGKIVRSIDQDWFKDMMHEYQKLVVTGVVSKESLLDNSAVFQEKLNSGQYALSYAWLKPDANALKEAGKTYRYRQLWLDMPYNFEQFAMISGPAGNDQNIGIFKDSVSEEDLPQVLRYMDYMMSDVGTKLAYWGPRSAGLFKEENGVRVYTDKELEDNMVYDVDNNRNVYYNLFNRASTTESNRTAFPIYPVAAAANMNHPKYVYNNIKLNPGKADTYFTPGMLKGLSKEEHLIYAQKGGSLTNYSAQWDIFGKGRDAFEKALTAPFAAKDDAQFEKLWQELKNVTDSVGLNEAMVAEINKIFFEENTTIIEDVAKINK
jgi:putative aldouronate transport system substrate-binding protein